MFYMQMSRPCRSWVTPMAFTAVWVKALRLWVVRVEVIRPSRWSIVPSSPHRSNTTTSRPAVPTASHSLQAHYRPFPDTSPSSPAWSTQSLAYPWWVTAEARTWLRGFAWWPEDTGRALICLREAAVGTRTSLRAQHPGWMKWIMPNSDSFEDAHLERDLEQISTSGQGLQSGWSLYLL